MIRSQLREHRFKMLSCADFYPAEKKGEQSERYFKEPSEEGEIPKGVEEIFHSVVMSERHEEFLEGKTEDIMRRVPEPNAEIDEVAQGWKTKRMGRAGLMILHLAPYGMLYDDEVSKKVTVNEAVELTEKFGGNESPTFISDVLAKLVQGQSMADVYSISQVDSHIKNMFTQDYLLSHISVKGEMSNCKYHSSGHIYFALKDEPGILSTVMLASQREGSTFTLQEGQQVVAPSFMNVHKRNGKYQLYIRGIKRDGDGDLPERYQKPRDELEEMGMFAPEYKRPVPKCAEIVGIVTASTDATIRDIMNISARRDPYAQLVLYPALVQGEQAKYNTVQGIKTPDRMGLNAMTVDRGGGSIEDLWAFDEEVVARVIFEYHISVISVVSHEADVIIADYMVDMRALTPPVAAKPAVFDYRQFEGQMTMYHQVLLRSMERKVERCKYWLEQYCLKLKMYHPEWQLCDRRQRLVEPEDRMKTIMGQDTVQERHRLTILNDRLHSLSPLQKIGRGFGFVTDGDGRRVESVETLHAGDMMEVRLADGGVRSQVVETKALAMAADNAEGSGKASGRK